MLQQYWWSVGPSSDSLAVRNAMQSQNVAVYRLDGVRLCRVSVLDYQLRLYMILHFSGYRNADLALPEV
jgi:hypothetical protein